jgi:hypothetical protein
MFIGVIPQLKQKFRFGNGEHPNFAKIKFVVGASCSLMSRKRAREPSLQKNKFTHLGCSLAMGNRQ